MNRIVRKICKSTWLKLILATCFCSTLIGGNLVFASDKPDPQVAAKDAQGNPVEFSDLIAELNGKDEVVSVQENYVPVVDTPAPQPPKANGTAINEQNGDVQGNGGELLPAGTPVYPTPPANNGGYIVENVGADNQTFVPPNFEKEDAAKDKKKSKDDVPMIEKRQFLTITTRSGKVFYLVINHEKDGEQAQLLTNVSEQDLLNLIVKRPEPTKPQPTVEKPKETEPAKQEVKKEEKSSTSFYVILFILGGIGFAGFYYVKIYLPKKNGGQIETEEEDNEEEELNDEEE